MIEDIKCLYFDKSLVKSTATLSMTCEHENIFARKVVKTTRGFYSTAKLHDF